MRSALPKCHSALLKYWISIIKCWFAWFLMMSFLPVFTVEIWRYYTVIGGPNNRLTGNGKNRVGNTSPLCMCPLLTKRLVGLWTKVEHPFFKEEKSWKSNHNVNEDFAGCMTATYANSKLGSSIGAARRRISASE
jgi:hypothetical protein